MTTGYINTRLSLQVAAGFTGGPQWNTTVNALASGREVRNQNWKYPRQQYAADLAAFSPAEIAELLALFYACAGQWGAFRYSDNVDYIAANETIAVAAGTMTPAQLMKNYAFGATTFARPIQAPVDGTVSVFTGSTPIAGTCDAQTGLFTPAANWPATPVQWSGQFDVWVRFTADYMPFTAVRSDLLTASIDLLEVLV
jgi:uncharacterized protein (TIGR02217 family)